jgi:hypothetical protein
MESSELRGRTVRSACERNQPAIQTGGPQANGNRQADATKRGTGAGMGPTSARPHEVGSTTAIAPSNGALASLQIEQVDESWDGPWPDDSRESESSAAPAGGGTWQWLAVHPPSPRASWSTCASGIHCIPARKTIKPKMEPIRFTVVGIYPRFMKSPTPLQGIFEDRFPCCGKFRELFSMLWKTPPHP